MTAAVALGVFLSRLPFLNLGYGRDPDAWRLANAAHAIAATGQYTVSRTPGYPVPELSYAALDGVPSLWLPLVALLSALAGVLFALILRRLGSKDYALGGLALCFTPTVFIHSTTLMDYTWALVAVLAALYALMNRRHLLAGLLTGVAVGCRITSVAMILPFLIIVLLHRNGVERSGIKSAVVFAASTIAVSALLYLPGLSQYGLGLFTYIDDDAGFGVAVKAATVRVWGSLGVAAIAIALIGAVVIRVFGSGSNTTFTVRPPRALIVAWLTAVGAFCVVYLQLPGVAGFLITAIPFALLCVAVVVPRRWWWVVCGALILSPFVEFDRSGLNQGLLLQDRGLRKTSMEKADNILRGIDRVQSDKVVLIAGKLTGQLQAIGTREKLYDRRQKLVFEYTVDATQLATYLAGGFDVYYVPDRDIFPSNAAVVDWVKGGAKLLHY